MKNKILLLRINEHPDIESEINSANADVKNLQERAGFLNKQKDKLVKEVKENREKHWDKLTGTDLAHSARGMKHHLQLLNGVKKTEFNSYERAGEALSMLIEESVTRNANVLRTMKLTEQLLEQVQ